MTSLIAFRSDELFSWRYFLQVSIFGLLLFACVQSVYMFGRALFIHSSTDDGLTSHDDLVHAMVFISWLWAHVLLAQSMRSWDSSPFRFVVALRLSMHDRPRTLRR